MGRGPPFPASWTGWQQATLGQESPRATAGRATEGTQSEDMAEVHLQTLRPRCGRRETTAAHISAPGPARGRRPSWQCRSSRRAGRGVGVGCANLTHRKPPPVAGLPT